MWLARPWLSERESAAVGSMSVPAGRAFGLVYAMLGSVTVVLWLMLVTFCNSVICRTARIALQNGPFQDAKWTESQCKTGRFANRYGE